MRVSIDFHIDKATLEVAIASLLMFGSLHINKKNIICKIKDEVLQKGQSVILFPELWGDDVADFLFKNYEEVSVFVERYKNIIGR